MCTRNNENNDVALLWCLAGMVIQYDKTATCKAFLVPPDSRWNFLKLPLIRKTMDEGKRWCDSGNKIYGHVH
jgi:hypothetical protein